MRVSISASRELDESWMRVDVSNYGSNQSRTCLPQVVLCHCQKYQGKPLLSVLSVTGFFYVHYTIHRIYCFMSHLKDEAVMVKCLAQRQKCQDQESNPHSAEQKYLSLTSMLLTVWPRHAEYCCQNETLTKQGKTQKGLSLALGFFIKNLHRSPFCSV